MNSDFSDESGKAEQPFRIMRRQKEVDLYEKHRRSTYLWTQKPYRSTGRRSWIEEMDSPMTDVQTEEDFLAHYIQDEMEVGVDAGQLVFEFVRTRWSEVFKYPSTEGTWSIQMVGVNTFCDHIDEEAINFIRTEQEIQNEFEEYFERINKIYSHLRDENVGYLPLERVLRGNLGVLDGRKDGFFRVIIMDSHHCSKRVKPLVAVYLIDHNTMRHVHPKRLMYAITLCIQQRSRANDFFLARMAPFRELLEFRSALKAFVEEHGSHFTATDMAVTENDVVIVELYHPNFSDPVSDILKIMTIQRFQPEKLPVLGDVRSNAFVIHAQADGTVFFQLTSCEFDLYREEINSISMDSYHTALAEGPYDVDQTNKAIYLTEYGDGYCYRVQILSDAEDNKVTVEFIDFGNTATVFKNTLVPSGVLNKYLPYFPRQALKARLINIEEMDMRYFRRLINEDLVIGVETLRYARKEKCAAVEIIRFQDINDELVHASDIMLTEGKEGFVRPWPEHKLQALTDEHITYDSFETIEMRGAVWCDERGKRVQLRTGAMIDVRIVQTINPGDFSIQPFGVQKNLRKLEKDLHVWYKRWSDSNDQHTYQDVIRDCLFCSIYLKDLGRRVRVQLVENPFKQQDSVRVLLLDYGRYIDVFKPELSTISQEACNALPCVGAKGILKRVIDSRYKGKKWMKEELRSFSTNVHRKRFLFKISQFEYDEFDCLKLVGDLYEHPSTRSKAKSTEQPSNTTEELHKMTMRELTHLEPNGTRSGKGSSSLRTTGATSRFINRRQIAT